MSRTATNRPRGLPDFKNPPLNELVLSIQFANTQFRNVHAGLLWKKVEAEYPKVEEQLVIDPVFETFGMPIASAVAPGLQVLTSGATCRYWFASASGNELLQVQPDRIVHNWRKTDEPATYPRYAHLRNKFESESALVSNFFRDQKLGEIQCNQCEVSYINLIPVEGLDFGSIFAFWKEPKLFSNPVERVNINFSYVMPNATESSEPLGRLHVSITTAIRRSDSTPVLRMTITARGKPKNESLAAAFEWLDRGHVEGVNSFAQLTTSEMHKSWGRTDG